MLDRLILIFTILPLIFLSSPAKACDPARITPQEIIESSDQIIIAQAISSAWAVELRPTFSNIVTEFFKSLRPDDELDREGETVFKIKRVVRGEAADYIKIRHYISPAACGVLFHPDHSYLLFVYEFKDKYYTSIFGVRPYLSLEEYQELLDLLGVKAEEIF